MNTLKKIFRDIIKINLYFLFFIYVFSSTTIAATIKQFQISGNERISDQTIQLFSGLELNDEINKGDLNKIIKNLYETSFFKNISINFENNILYINVIENPLIQSLQIEGIKRESYVTNN